VIFASELRRARVKFALTFGVVAGALLTLYSFPYGEHGLRESFFEWYLSGYARMTGAVLRLSDPGVRVVGREITGGTSLTIAKNCDAMDVNILLVAAMLAFPCRWSFRAAGIAGGLALLLAANVARIFSLYQVGARWPRAFDVVHAEVWPLALVILGTVVFVVWSRWTVRAARARG
jgi:exosortase/archaeosortase family protein